MARSRLKLILGIQIIQDQSRILFYYDPKQGKKWNHLRYQSRGLLSLHNGIFNDL